jgi:hypothetical protein
MFRVRRCLGLFLVVLAAIAAPPAGARGQPLAPAEVPPALRPWVPWALDGIETFGCTYLPDGTPRCVWPGELSIAVEPGGARFELAVTLDRPAPVPLPGDESRWPLDVRVDGRAAPVRRAPRLGGAPVVDVSAGPHRIQGHFTWAAPPETLTVPAAVGVTVLRTPAGVVTRPRRDAGTLWLQSATREAAEEDALSVEVFRRIDDGVPMRVTTRIVLRVAGQPREIELGPALLEGSDPISVLSDAPVRATEAGELTLQVHAGFFQVEIVAARAAIDAPLRALARGPLWPAQEVWVWSADEALRQVELAGADRIDPERTNLPAQWRSLPTYLVDASAGSLEIRTTRRGNPAPPPNQLTLSREIWLDPDGRGLTAVDRIAGTMHQRFRLELTQGVLGRATVDGQPHLVSTREGRAGVEIRRPRVDVVAEWRDESAGGAFEAVGWDEDVQSLEATLHLAPGFRLIAASGVDRADTWLSQWNLWGFFFVLVISLALWRLAGPAVGVIAFAVLVISYGQPDAPFLAWLPLVLAFALAKALPEGRVRALMRGAFTFFFAILAVIAVYFAGMELRRHLYPQAVAGAAGGQEYEYIMEAPGTATAAPGAEAWSDDESGIRGLDARGESGGGGGPGESGPRLLRAQNLDGYEPNAVLQTGPGLPTWHQRGGHTVQLTWDGPVTRGTEVRLWLLTPMENGAMAVIEVALLGLLLVLVYRARPRAPVRPAADAAAPASGSGSGSAAAAAVAVAMAVSIAAVPGAQAQEGAAGLPTPALLEELRARLTRPPLCAPDCAEVSSATIAIEGALLVVELDVAASALAAVALPGPLDVYTPTAIALDGSTTRAAARIDDGYLYLRVPEGVHRVRLEGPLPGSDAFTLAFARPPHHAIVRAPGWEVDGLRDGGQVGSSIQFRRVMQRAGEVDRGDGGSSVRITPWLALERRLALGIRWEATTTVRRISAPGSPIVARIPLLPGESVLAADVPVEGGAAVVTLGGNETERTWSSALTPREELVLSAASGERRSETWIVECAAVWRCEASGLDPVSIEEGDRWSPRFRPFPGDTLRVQVARLPAAEGQATTIDAATLRFDPGERMTLATLTLDVRSSVGTTQTITLPEGATVRGVTVNGARRAFEQRDRQVALTITPGSTRVELEWQEPRMLGVVYQTPPVTLSGGAVNASVRIDRPHRWILWLSGPTWGPAVLFWPYLIVLLAVAMMLARTLRGGLNTVDWLLLGFGLSLLPWQVVWIPPSWVALIEWRKRRIELPDPWLFDLRQLAIVFWTFVTAIVLYAVIHVGLLLDPDTSIIPAGSVLEWYVDRLEGTDATMPTATVISVPIWVYRVVMLLWSLWLAARSIAWSRWAFYAFIEGGLSRVLVPPKAPPAAGSAPPAAPPKAPAVAQSEPPKAPPAAGSAPPAAPPKAPAVAQSEPESAAGTPPEGPRLGSPG